MQRTVTGTKHYYGKDGAYLGEHARFFKIAKVEKDVAFLKKALKLNKRQHILDIACGQGRHAHALAREGYSVDGVDFSDYLLSLAKLSSNTVAKRQPIFYRADVTKLALKNSYDRAYWFFSDLANINPAKALLSISKNLKMGGMLVLDTDNVFRLIGYLNEHPKSEFTFDAQSMELFDKDNGLTIPYPVMPMWQDWARQAGLRVERAIGDYKFHPYTITSPRLILVIRKTARIT
mgnify:CR=1 FL=1